jgi:hypothetical protein
MPKTNSTPAGKLEAESHIHRHRPAIERMLQRSVRAQCLSASNKLKPANAKSLYEGIDWAEKPALSDAAASDIDKALKFSKATDQAVLDFTKGIKALDAKQKADPSIDGSTEIQTLMSKAIDAMNRQYAQELAEVKALDFKALFPGADDKAVQAKMEAALKKSHEDRVNQFKKSVQPDTEQQHRVQQQVEAQMVFLAHINKLNYNKNKSIIDQLIADRNQAAAIEAGGLVASIVDLDDPLIFENIDLAGIENKEIKLGFGRTMQIGAGSESITVNLSKFRSLTKSGLSEEDTDTICLLAKGAGWDSITLTIDDSTPPDKRQAQAKQCFESALRAGFRPEEITVKYVASSGDEHGREAMKEYTHKNAGEIGVDFDTQSLLSKDPKNKNKQKEIRDEAIRLRSTEPTPAYAVTPLPGASGPGAIKA